MQNILYLFFFVLVLRNMQYKSVTCKFMSVQIHTHDYMYIHTYIIYIYIYNIYIYIYMYVYIHVCVCLSLCGCLLIEIVCATRHAWYSHFQLVFIAFTITVCFYFPFFPIQYYSLVTTLNSSSSIVIIITIVIIIFIVSICLYLLIGQYIFKYLVAQRNVTAFRTMFIYSFICI